MQKPKLSLGFLDLTKFNEFCKFCGIDIYIRKFMYILYILLVIIFNVAIGISCYTFWQKGQNPNTQLNSME